MDLDYRCRLVRGCLKNVLSLISLIELLIGSLIELGGRDIEYDATVRKAEDAVGIGLSKVRLVQAANDRNAF